MPDQGFGSGAGGGTTTDDDDPADEEDLTTQQDGELDPGQGGGTVDDGGTTETTDTDPPDTGDDTDGTTDDPVDSPFDPGGGDSPDAGGDDTGGDFPTDDTGDSGTGGGGDFGDDGDDDGGGGGGGGGGGDGGGDPGDDDGGGGDVPPEAPPGMFDGDGGGGGDGGGTQPPGGGGDDTQPPGGGDDPPTGPATPGIGGVGHRGEDPPERDFVDATPDIPTSEVKEQLALEVIQTEPGVDSLPIDQVEQVGSGAYIVTWVEDGEQQTRRFAVDEMGQDFFQEQRIEDQLEEQGLESEDYHLIPTDDGVRVELTDQGMVDEEYQQSVLEQNLGTIAADLGLDREDIRVNDQGEIELTVMGRGEVGGAVRADIQEAVQDQRAERDRLVETTRRGWSQLTPSAELDSFEAARLEARQRANEIQDQRTFAGATAAATLLQSDAEAAVTRREELQASTADRIEEQLAEDQGISVQLGADDVALDASGGSVTARLTEEGQEQVRAASERFGGTSELEEALRESDESIMEAIDEEIDRVGEGLELAMNPSGAALEAASGVEATGADAEYLTDVAQGTVGIVTGAPIVLIEAGEYGQAGLTAAVEERTDGYLTAEGGEIEEFGEQSYLAARDIKRQVQTAVTQRPQQFGAMALGSLVGSGLTIGGATRFLGGRAGRAAAFAIQPGEEIAITAARAGLISSRTARFVPGVREGHIGQTTTGTDTGGIDTSLRRGRVRQFLSDERGMAELTGRGTGQEVELADERAIAEPEGEGRLVHPPETELDYTRTTRGPRGRQHRSRLDYSDLRTGEADFSDALDRAGQMASRSRTETEGESLLELARRQEAQLDDDELAGVRTQVMVDQRDAALTLLSLSQASMLDQAQQTEAAVDVDADTVMDVQSRFDVDVDSRVDLVRGVDQRLDQDTETRIDTGQDTLLETRFEPPRFDRPREPRFEPPRFDPPRQEPPTETDPEVDDDDDREGDQQFWGRTESFGAATDTSLQAGWASEQIAAFAGVSRASPSDSELEDRPRVERYTGTLPVEGADTEAYQETLEAFTFADLGTDQDDSDWGLDLW